MKERLEEEDAEEGGDGTTELKDGLGLTSLFVSVFVTDLLFIFSI
jgi:hypothetical protein